MEVILQKKTPILIVLLIFLGAISYGAVEQNAKPQFGEHSTDIKENIVRFEGVDNSPKFITEYDCTINTDLYNTSYDGCLAYFQKGVDNELAFSIVMPIEWLGSTATFEKGQGGRVSEFIVGNKDYFIRVGPGLEGGNINDLWSEYEGNHPVDYGKGIDYDRDSTSFAIKSAEGYSNIIEYFPENYGKNIDHFDQTKVISPEKDYRYLKFIKYKPYENNGTTNDYWEIYDVIFNKNKTSYETVLEVVDTIDTQNLAETYKLFNE
ncbi:MAG: hypothetical protein ACOZAO_03105 [Patescibacteria group bacterium]